MKYAFSQDKHQILSDVLLRTKIFGKVGCTSKDVISKEIDVQQLEILCGEIWKVPRRVENSLHELR
jgi:hypothetical protein